MGGPGDVAGGPGNTAAAAPAAAAPATTATEAPAGITDTTCSLSGTEYCGEYSIEDTTYGTMMTVTLSATTRDIASNAVPDFDTGYDDTITADEISYSYPLVPVWTGAQTVTRAPGISIHGIPLDPAGQDIDCDGTALSLEVCPRVGTGPAGMYHGVCCRECSTVTALFKRWGLLCACCRMGGAIERQLSSE